MSTTTMSDKFIMLRIHGMQMAEKRLLMMLQADVKEGSSDEELDALLQMISKGLRDISHMQNEIITLQLIEEDTKK